MTLGGECVENTHDMVRPHACLEITPLLCRTNIFLEGFQARSLDWGRLSCEGVKGLLAIQSTESSTV